MFHSGWALTHSTMVAIICSYTLSFRYIPTLRITTAFASGSDIIPSIIITLANEDFVLPLPPFSQ